MFKLNSFCNTCCLKLPVYKYTNLRYSRQYTNNTMKKGNKISPLQILGRKNNITKKPKNKRIHGHIVSYVHL